MKLSIRLFFILFLSTIAVHSKVLFITHGFNRPDFIEIQVKTFDALLEDEYELVVFNDANDYNMERLINTTCDKLGLRHFRVPQHLHHRPESSGHRHMDGIQFALDTIGYDYDGVVVLIDSDCFLIKPFSVEKYMDKGDLMGVLQSRSGNGIEIRYLFPGLVFMNMQKLEDKRTLSFEGGYIYGLGCDVGAHTHYYIKNHPLLNLKFLSHIYISRWQNEWITCDICTNMSCSTCTTILQNHGFDEPSIRFVQECPDGNIEFFLDQHFMHYLCGSNWNNAAAHYVAAKTNALNNLIQRLIQ